LNVAVSSRYCWREAEGFWASTTATKIMKSESEDYTPNGGLWHGLDNLLTSLALLWLFWSFLEFLWKRKATAWLGWAVLFFIPVTISMVMVINTFIFLIEDHPWSILCSDGLFCAETIVGLVTSSLVGVAIACDKTEAKRRTGQVKGSKQPVAGSATPKPAFKKCSWCGKKYRDEVTVCALDGKPVI
jgi:hypothetical protein